LIVEVCGGRAGPLSDAVGPLPERKPILLRSARATRLLGIALPPDTIADVFTRLALSFTRHGDDFIVTPPSYRFDLAIEEDLIEEVARIHGYDKIPATPGAHLQRMLAAPEGARGLSALRHRLAARDWQEVITFSFVDSTVERALDPQVRPVTVLNPIAAQRDVMRTSLLPGLIETLQTNLRRKLPRVRIFEVGRVFAHADLTQPVRISGLAFGPADPEQWGAKTRQVDFFDVKRDLEALAAPVPIATVARSWPWLHPGRSARITVAGSDVGWIGELHPRLVRHFDLPSAPVVFELDTAALAQVPLPIGHAVSRFPSLRRDIAITINENIMVRDILDALNQVKPDVVETLDVFDIYRGAELPDGRKSVAILVLMRDTQRTLTDEDGEGVVALLVATLRDRLGASLR
jgi:phenylalanyl-tRNA synthetase beta chain